VHLCGKKKGQTTNEERKMVQTWKEREREERPDAVLVGSEMGVLPLVVVVAALLPPNNNNNG